MVQLPEQPDSLAIWCLHLARHTGHFADPEQAGQLRSGLSCSRPIREGQAFSDPMTGGGPGAALAIGFLALPTCDALIQGITITRNLQATGQNGPLRT